MKILNHKYSLLLITVICLFSVGCKTDREKKNVTFEKDSSSVYELIMKGRDIYIYKEEMMNIYMCLMRCSFMIYSKENIKGYIILT